MTYQSSLNDKVWRTKLTLFNDDILKFDAQSLSETQNLLYLETLPYNISTEILM